MAGIDLGPGPIAGQDRPDAADRTPIEGDPLAPYVVGSSELYRWAADRWLPTPSPSRTIRRAWPRDDRRSRSTPHCRSPRWSVNDERIARSALSGIGGQPDYAAAATWHRDGLSVLALPTSAVVSRRWWSGSTALRAHPDTTLTLSSTSWGSADIRGLSRDGRVALARLWTQI